MPRLLKPIFRCEKYPYFIENIHLRSLLLILEIDYKIILENTHYNTWDTRDRILDIIMDNAHYNTLDTWYRMLDDNG